MKKNPSTPRKKFGFTLVELLVAMVIAIIIMGILVGITNVAMGAWQRSRAEVRAARQAKTMLDSISKDLESLVLRSGNNYEWLYARTVTSLPGSSRDNSTNAAEFICFSAATDRYNGEIGTTNDKGGDVSTISYKLAYQDPVEGVDNNDSTYVFYRQLVDPKPTFDAILAKQDLKQAFDSTGGNNRFENRRSAGGTETMFDFVCENVYQYSITFRVDVTKTVGTVTTIIPVRVTLGDNANAKEFRIFGDRIQTDASVVTKDGPSVTKEEIQAGRLSNIEISITVLSDSGMNQLRTRTFSNAEEKAKFLQKNSFEYSKAIDVPGM